MIHDVCIKLESRQIEGTRPSEFFMKLYLTKYLQYAFDENGKHTKIFFKAMNALLRETEVSE